MVTTFVSCKSTMDDSLCSELSADISASSLFTSTPRARKGRKSTAGPGTFKVPKPRARKNPICGICHICGKEYVRKKSFEDHLRTHALHDANSKYPDSTKLSSETLTIARDTLKRMTGTPSLGKWGKEHSQFLLYVMQKQDSSQEWSEFCRDISEHFISALSVKFFLPSALTPIIYKVADQILTDLEFRKVLLGTLSVLKECNDAMLECFICEYVLTFGEEVLIFISRYVVGERPRKAPKQPLLLDIEDRQVIFYVGGSVIKGFIRMSWTNRKNKDWCAIGNVIRQKIQEGDGVTGVPRCAQSDRAWTEEVNRKSLIFIGAPTMDFLVSLTHLLYDVESDKEGNFKLECVMKDVYEDSVLILLWDEIIGTSLEPDLSTRFLRGVVKSFTQTYAKGVAQKKLNNHLKKAFAAINLRHSVAPRQQT